MSGTFDRCDVLFPLQAKLSAHFFANLLHLREADVLLAALDENPDDLFVGANHRRHVPSQQGHARGCGYQGIEVLFHGGCCLSDVVHKCAKVQEYAEGRGCH